MKLLNTNEERLMRSDYFAALVSLIAAAHVMLPLLLSARTKIGENEFPAKVKIEDSLAFRYVTCTRAAIIYTANDNNKCNLCIETLDGDVLYNESIRTMGKSTRVFDFLNLEDGTYKVIARKNGRALSVLSQLKAASWLAVDALWLTQFSRLTEHVQSSNCRTSNAKMLLSRCLTRKVRSSIRQLKTNRFSRILSSRKLRLAFTQCMLMLMATTTSSTTTRNKLQKN